MHETYRYNMQTKHEREHIKTDKYIDVCYSIMNE